MVYFPVTATAPFATTAFPAPTGVHTAYIAGLDPGGAYGVTTQTSPTGTVLTVNPNGTGYTADSAGLLKVTF